MPEVHYSQEQAHPMDVLWTQIRVLERRAQSRDEEARRLRPSETERIQSLERESRELRKQAQALRKQRIDTLTHALGKKMDLKLNT